MRRWVLVLVLVLVLLAGGAVALRALGKTEAANRAKLIEEAREALDDLRAELAAEGIETFVGSTLRTEDEQSGLVLVGASATNQSWHLLRRAVDLYVIDPATKQPDLNAKLWDTLYRRMHQVAPRFGWTGIAFNPDGSKKYINTSAGKKWDGAHLEFRGGMTWATAAAQYKASGGFA